MIGFGFAAACASRADGRGPDISGVLRGDFQRHPAIRRSALVGVGPAGRQRPVIVLEPHRGQMPKARSSGPPCSTKSANSPPRIR